MGGQLECGLSGKGMAGLAHWMGSLGHHGRGHIYYRAGWDWDGLWFVFWGEQRASSSIQNQNAAISIRSDRSIFPSSLSRLRVTSPFFVISSSSSSPLESLTQVQSPFL
jgi:hypothetical protein